MPSAINACVEILDGAEALNQFSADLGNNGDLYGWVYLIEPNFATTLLVTQNPRAETRLIVDHDMATIAAKLQRELRNFQAWAWAYNRTMHDKTYIFPSLSVTWIGTYNLTRGSYHLSRNRTVRITHTKLAEAMLREWMHDREHARKIQTAKPEGD